MDNRASWWIEARTRYKMISLLISTFFWPGNSSLYLKSFCYKKNIVGFILRTESLYRGTVGALWHLIVWLADPGAGAGVLTLSVNTGLQSENGDTHLDCETGSSSQIYNLYWVGLKLWCMRSFPLRAEFSQDWVCCKLNKFCVPWSSDQGGDDVWRDPEPGVARMSNIYNIYSQGNFLLSSHNSQPQLQEDVS